MFHILLIVLLISFYQDIRFRGIQWFLFPLILVFSLAYNWGLPSITVVYNVLFVVLCLLGLTIYLSLKEGRIVTITKGYFSWGDILILIALSPLFTFESYILFFTIGTVFTLITFLTMNIWLKSQTIPYAGYMALFAIITLLSDIDLTYLIKT